MGRLGHCPDGKSRLGDRVGVVILAPHHFGGQAPRPLVRLYFRVRSAFTAAASAPFPKFVIRRSTLCHELRKTRSTSKSMILVPLFDLKFLVEFAATAVGTSNRRH